MPDVYAARDLIQRSDVMLVQLEIPLDAVLAGIEIAKASGALAASKQGAQANMADRETIEILLGTQS